MMTPTRAYSILASWFVAAVVAVVLISLATGCTSSATKLAINTYQTSEAHCQNAFDNVYRIGNEQLLLNLKQYLKANKDPAMVNKAITATWQAKDELVECRVQYIYGRTLRLVSTGQYLYDQQGFLNILGEEADTFFKTVKTPASAATQPSPLQDAQSILKMLPASQPATKGTP